MAVTITDYGNWYTLQGTLAEVMGEIKGKSPDTIIAMLWNGTAYVAVCYRKT